MELQFRIIHPYQKDKFRAGAMTQWIKPPATETVQVKEQPSQGIQPRVGMCSHPEGRTRATLEPCHS